MNCTSAIEINLHDEANTDWYPPTPLPSNLNQTQALIHVRFSWVVVLTEWYNMLL